VTSSTHKSKSKTYVYVKNNNIFMKHNSFTIDIPVVVILKALSLESDQEIVQLVGSETIYLNGIAGSLEQCSKLNIFTKEQALVRLSLSLNVEVILTLC
jgi:DNA-directed RNA polymerase III subunit RPC2